MGPRRRLRGVARLHCAVARTTIRGREPPLLGRTRDRPHVRRPRSLAARLFHDAAGRVRDIWWSQQAPRRVTADPVDGAIDTTPGLLAFERVAEEPKTSDDANCTTSTSATTPGASARLHRRQYRPGYRARRSRAACWRFQGSFRSQLSCRYSANALCLSG